MSQPKIFLIAYERERESLERKGVASRLVAQGKRYVREYVELEVKSTLSSYPLHLPSTTSVTCNVSQYKQPTRCNLVTEFIIPPFIKGQHVSSGTPLIIRSSNCICSLWFTYCNKVKDFVYTGCPRRNVPDFGRVFLMLKFTDITQNT